MACGKYKIKKYKTKKVKVYVKKRKYNKYVKIKKI